MVPLTPNSADIAGIRENVERSIAAFEIGDTLGGIQAAAQAVSVTVVSALGYAWATGTRFPVEGLNLVFNSLTKNPPLWGQILQKAGIITDPLMASKFGNFMASITAGASAGYLWNELINGINSLHLGSWLYDILNPDLNTHFLAARTPPRYDPLAIDLDGDGIETVGVAAGVLFDHNADGIKTGTGWLKGDDAFLVLDRDGNGLIDSGRELFGVDTIVATDPYGGVQYAANGFVALASIDSNGDKIFDANDAQFANVRLWRDLNQDGISQADELQGLAAAGITAINLSTHQATKALPGGNTQTLAADVAGIDGSAVSLNLASSPFYRQFPDHLDTTAVADLPDMQGSGSLRDLREASTQSATLQGDLRALATQGYVNRIACRAIKVSRGGTPANGEWRRVA